MASNHQRTPRRARPPAVSLPSISTPTGTESVTVLNTVTNGDMIRRQADTLDAEAAYYRHRAIQEEQALGPGHYVDLLQKMASHQATMAQQLRASKGAPQKSGSTTPSATA